jgi:hypothetical protein
MINVNVCFSETGYFKHVAQDLGGSLAFTYEKIGDAR